MSTEESIEAVRELASELGEEVVDDHSGRGMYGETCMAIISHEYSPSFIVEQAASRGLRGTRTDSMGKGYVVYWPSLITTLEEEEID